MGSMGDGAVHTQFLIDPNKATLDEVPVRLDVDKEGNNGGGRLKDGIEDQMLKTSVRWV